MHLKRLHFMAVGYWCLEPNILLNIDDVRGNVTKGSIFHLRVLLLPFIIQIRSLVVEKRLHTHLTVIRVLTLEDQTIVRFAIMKILICDHTVFGFQLLLHTKGALALHIASTGGCGLKVDIFIVSCLLKFLLNTERDELQ